MQKNSSKNTQDRVVFITGASSGIGTLCEEYLRQGWNVIGLAEMIPKYQMKQLIIKI